MKNPISLIVALSVGVFAISCSNLSTSASTQPVQTASGAAVKKATADLAPTQGNQVKGQLMFEQTGQGVKVTGHLTGLQPGTHGFHIHEHGDCSAPDASSAGAHFNPGSKPHGAPTDPERHAGDLGNIEANAQGEAHVELTVAGLTLGEGPNSAVGNAVIVHEKADDFKSQPSGNAGTRLACGVVRSQ